jgi:two-component system sensor histidine kinase UhpB
MQIQRPRLTRRDDSLIGQVVAANVVLVALTILAAGLDLSITQQRWQFLVLALAIILTLCVNLWMLQRRFAPLEHLIERVEGVDPSHPASLRLEDENFDEVDRLAQSFKRLLDRIEVERRRGGRLVVRAQEEERRRLARDLHDEVNQALTAILLRLEALAQESPPERTREVAELKLLVNQAMDELTGLARQLRPSALDDHGLIPAVEAQLRRFSSRSGVQTRIATHGDPSILGEDEQIAVYRIAQEAITNAGRHSGAKLVEVELTLEDGCTELNVSDDGQGFEASSDGSDGLGLKGMAERARLVGGELDVRSTPGNGTTVTLRIQ